MAHYRLYFLDHASRIAGRHDLECDDDHDACRQSSRLGSGRMWELWRGQQRVDCLKLVAEKDAMLSGDEA
jgi:hypothetical protein